MSTEPTMDAGTAQELRDLIRLGWAVAEVRGLVDRIALGPSDQGKSTATVGPDEAEKRGPLATDDVRSAADRLGWASNNLASLVSRIRENPTQTQKDKTQTQKDNELPELPSEIKDVSGNLKTTIGVNGQLSKWRQTFVNGLIQWDQQVRNKLSSWERRERSAYLFGRELAETYWCLNVQAKADEPDSWSTLLSKDRVRRLNVELRQLGAAVDVRRARCLQASLGKWRDFVAAGGQRKRRNAFDCLDRQVQVWQSLLEADTDLDGLRPPTSFLRGVNAGLSVVRAMWVQIVVLTGFTVLLVWGAWLLSHMQQHGFLSAIVTAVGAIGVTGSALATKAKAEAIHLIENINAAIDSDLDAAATTVVPESPRARLRDRLSVAGSRTPELSVIVYPALPAVSGNKLSETPQTGGTGQADATTEQASSVGDSSTPSESVSPTVTSLNAADPGAAPAGPS